MTWNFNLDEAPRDRKFLGAVDGDVRMVRWGKTSHVPLYGFILVDQGPEDADLCNPLAWGELPVHPGHLQSQSTKEYSEFNRLMGEDKGSVR